MLKWLGKVLTLQAVVQFWPWILAALLVLAALWMFGRRVQRRADRDRREMLSRLASDLRMLERLRDGWDGATVPSTEEHAEAALALFERFGKGRR